MSKFRVPVTINTYATYAIGYVDCDSVEEFNEKSEALWESQGYDYPTTNITNEFDLGDWEIMEVKTDDLNHYAAKPLISKG